MHPEPAGATFVEILRRRAERHPERVAFIRWSDDVLGERSLTYGELDSQARAVAASLQARNLGGTRAILLSTPGLEYVAAFFGCLYGNVIPVPCYPPAALARRTTKAGPEARHTRIIAKLQSVAAKAGVSSVLTHGSDGGPDVSAAIGAPAASAPTLKIRDLLATDPARWRPDAPSPDALAFLQFTSGSTTAPRGVMVTHRNLIHNSVLIKEAFGHTEGTLVGVIWLPPYHDMGLIGGILQPVLCGGRCVLMAPTEFLQRPLRWLEAITRHRGTTSGGPNFAYDLCAQRIAADERQRLDLSSWSVAFSGAEPVRAPTIERFSKAFAASRFEARAFFPCYGLAEATLAVSGGRRLSGAHVATVDRAALTRNEAIDAEPLRAGVMTLVACGGALADQLCIVDPATCTELPARRVGEIWLRGSSVARGYWNDPVESAAAFAAVRSDGAGPFLRTGDLGYLDEAGQLFIVGRRRDLIILRGRNLHPIDLEQTVEASHLVIRSGGCAVFGVGDEEEHLVVIAEVDPRSGKSRDGRHSREALGAVAAAVAGALLQEHDNLPAVVQLVPAGSLPRTTSGKVERYACRERYQNRSFAVLHELRRDDAAARAQVARRPPATPLEQRVAAICRRVLGIAEVSLDDDFFALGGHSLLALELVEGLREELGVEVPLQALAEHATIDALCRFVEGAAPTESPAERAPVAAPDRFEPFPLTEVQEAYFFGRSPAFELGNVSAQGTAEFDVSDLDPDRLRAAVDRLVRRHDMLRAVIRSDGKQQVLAETPPFPLEVHDFSALAGGPQTERLDAIRDRLTHASSPSSWPMFDLVVCRLDQSRWRMIARIDLLIADLYSIRLLWRELGSLYTDPDAPLPDIDVSFRGWVLHQHGRPAAREIRT